MVNMVTICKAIPIGFSKKNPPWLWVNTMGSRIAAEHKK